MDSSPTFRNIHHENCIIWMRQHIPDTSLSLLRNSFYYCYLVLPSDRTTNYRNMMLMSICGWIHYILRQVWHILSMAVWAHYKIFGCIFKWVLIKYLPDCILTLCGCFLLLVHSLRPLKTSKVNNSKTNIWIVVRVRDCKLILITIFITSM